MQNPDRVILERVGVLNGETLKKVSAMRQGTNDGLMDLGMVSIS